MIMRTMHVKEKSMQCNSVGDDGTHIHTCIHDSCEYGALPLPPPLVLLSTNGGFMIML